MKVSRKKIVDALNKRLVKHEAMVKGKYEESLKEKLRWAESSLKDYIETVPKKKKAVAEAKDALTKFKANGVIPEHFVSRFRWDDRDRERLIRLQRKLDFCEGDQINVTDAEMSLLG